MKLSPSTPITKKKSQSSFQYYTPKQQPRAHVWVQKPLMLECEPFGGIIGDRKEKEKEKVTPVARLVMLIIGDICVRIIRYGCWCEAWTLHHNQWREFFIEPKTDHNI